MREASAIRAEAARRLAERFGASAVLDAPTQIAPYRGDLMYRQEDAELCVFRPSSAEMLSEGLALLADLPILLVPRGGGSGLAGGATPGAGAASLVVSTERMRTLRRIDRDACLMVAEAGVVLAEAQAAAREAGLHLGLTHGGAGSATLGGSVAANAGGANVLRHGMARDQILGIEAVLADGTLIGGAAELWKDNTGYSLPQLLAGSEGTLAFVTAVTLKLRAPPLDRQAALFGVAGPVQALALLGLARDLLGDAVTAAELMSRSATDFAAGMGVAKVPLESAPGWLLLLEAERTSRFFDLAAGFDALLEAAFEEGLAGDGVLAQSEAQRLGLWSLREGVAEAMDLWRGPILRTDCAVPLGQVPRFVAGVDAHVAALGGGLRAAFFGHIGDGNIHVNVMPPAPGDALPGKAALSEAIESIALSLGGTVSAEHGIGLHKRAALRRMKPAAELALMGRIKSAFDPANRLNPGKIFGSCGDDAKGAPEPP
ncbi:FAD-binding oxidoreductase [Salipiger pacificus]|nr:FAD-binding oxidoreductase [Alloyangia pacifica]